MHVHPQPRVELAADPPRAAAVALLEAAGLPSGDLDAVNLTDFHYAGPAAAPLGLVGLEIYGAHALLRSLVVAPDARSLGLGARLLARAEAHARARGVATLYLLTTTAAEYFVRFGYLPADRAAAPGSIRATREYGGLCPASAVFLCKSLEREGPSP